MSDDGGFVPSDIEMEDIEDEISIAQSSAEWSRADPSPRSTAPPSPTPMGLSDATPLAGGIGSGASSLPPLGAGAPAPASRAAGAASLPPPPSLNGFGAAAPAKAPPAAIPTSLSPRVAPPRSRSIIDAPAPRRAAPAATARREQKETAAAATRAKTTKPPHPNPVIARQMALSARRREAFLNADKMVSKPIIAPAGRGGGGGSERTTTTTRRGLGGGGGYDPVGAAPAMRRPAASGAGAGAKKNPSSSSHVVGTSRRTVEVDLVTALPATTAARKPRTKDAADDPPRPRATVRVVAPRDDASGRSQSRYKSLPAHQTYNWYKYYGFAGQGAKTSWGYNPKRADIQEKYGAVRTPSERRWPTEA